MLRVDCGCEGTEACKWCLGRGAAEWRYEQTAAPGEWLVVRRLVTGGYVVVEHNAMTEAP